MVGHIKLALLTAFALIILAPSSALAQGTSLAVYPAEARVDNLPPGETAGFNLTITNKDAVDRVFVFSTFQPARSQRREGRAPFPDDSWISFSPPRIRVGPGAQANVTVTVAVPPDNRWAGQAWETWLGVTAESSSLLVLQLYVRLLVSTSGNRFNAQLAVVTAVAAILLGCGLYYHFRRTTGPARH